MQQNKALIHDLTKKINCYIILCIRGTQLFLTHATRQRIKIIGISLFYFENKISIMFFVIKIYK